MLIGKPNTILDDQALFILDCLDKVFYANGIEKPVPSLLGNFCTVTIRVEVLFAVEVESK